MCWGAFIDVIYMLITDSSIITISKIITVIVQNMNPSSPRPKYEKEDCRQ